MEGDEGGPVPPRAARALSPLTWGIYDFANSLASIAVAFYFAPYVVQELGRGDLWVSVPVALATVLLLLTLPFFGMVADRIGRYKPALAATTGLAIAALLGLGIATQLTRTEPAWFWAVLACYLVFQYAFQAALAFYYPYLQEIARRHSRERTVSVGSAAGQLGNIVGLAAFFPLASGAVVIIGFSGAPLIFLLAAALFLAGYAVFSTRFDENRADAAQARGLLPRSFGEVIGQLRDLRNEPNILRYLVAYYLFADAILTLNLFMSLYLGTVGGLGTGEKTLTFVLGLVAAVVGALLTPWFLRKVGNLKRAQLWLLGAWSVLLLLLAFARTPAQFMAIAAVNGLSFGMLFCTSRVIYSKLIPPDQPARYFGIYVLFERFASVLGPLVWSACALAFAFTGPATRYRFALGALAVVVAGAYAVMRGVREEYRS